MLYSNSFKYGKTPEREGCRQGHTLPRKLDVGSLSKPLFICPACITKLIRKVARKQWSVITS